MGGAEGSSCIEPRLLGFGGWVGAEEGSQGSAGVYLTRAPFCARDDRLVFSQEAPVL